MAVYFGEQASLASRSPTRVLPTQTATPVPPPAATPTPPTQSHKSNIGAVVGGTVGGAAVLIIAICGFLFCLRRRKRNQQTQAPSSHPDVTSLPSSMHGYPSDAKYSVAVTSPHSPPSTARSPNLSTHQQADSITHSSPYATPPPVQPEHSYHHPAHDQSPIPYYPPPPPDASRVNAVGRTHSHEMPGTHSSPSHEMPTVRSPQVANVARPKPLRLEVGHD